MNNFGNARGVFGPSTQEALDVIKTRPGLAGEAFVAFVERIGAEKASDAVEDMLGWCLALQTALYRDGGYKL